MNSKQKADLRNEIGEEISAFTDDYIKASDDGLYNRVTTLKEFVDSRNIMLYYSVKREPSTLRIINIALSQGKTVSLPYCYRSGIMDARTIRDLSELSPLMLGIPAPPVTAQRMAPQELDMIIVPALAYDSRGYRIGYGGGYYDRFLSGIPAYTVGLARERLMRHELPIDDYDIAVKCIVTEERVFCPTLPKK